MQTKAFRRFRSPLQRISQAQQQVGKIETIQAFAVPPWEKRIDIIVKLDHQEAAQTANDAQGIVVATSSSEKNGIVGIGGAIYNTTTTGSSIATFSRTLGLRSNFNSYFAELTAISTAL